MENIAKYLREQQNLYIEIICVSALYAPENQFKQGYCFIFRINRLKPYKWNVQNSQGNYYPTYESALEAGIIECFKLIK